MLRVFPLILACLFLFPGSRAEAAENHPASQARAPSALSPQDLETIFAMADRGDAGSQNYLGFLYATGQSVAKDEKTAFAWFQKAADQGHPEALGNLAMMYEKGLGVAKNLRTALTLHRQAAMAGYPVSMKRLANLYESGFNGEERDPVKAEMWKTRYKETLKSSASAANDATPRQAAEKSPATAQAEKPAAPKPAALPANLPPQAAATPAPLLSKPVSPPSPDKAKPYFIQIGGKATATAREAMEVTQKIIEKNLLPQNKKIELVNPDGKSYRINIGPFADAQQAAPFKTKIMALLKAAPQPAPAPRAMPPEATQTQPAPAATVAVPTPPVQAAPASTRTAEKSSATAPVAPLPAQAAARIAEKPVAAAQMGKTAAKPPMPAVAATAVATPASAAGIPAGPSLTAKTEDGDMGKNHFVEVSGQASAREATELLQKIVKKGMLPKNMQVELVNVDADNYRIRIGPFADAANVAPQMAKIVASIKSNPPPSHNPTVVTQELVPVAAPAKPPVSAVTAAPAQNRENAPAQPTAPPAETPKIATAPAPVAPPQKQGISSPKIALVPAPKTDVAPAAGVAPAKLAEERRPAAKIVRGRYYFIQTNAKSTFEDSMSLAQSLFIKELIQTSRRVRIENLDAKNFRVSIGPFSDVREASQQLQKVQQQTSQALSVVALEKHASASDNGDQPFVQVNTQGTLDNAASLANTLVEKGLIAPQAFVEIVNFGAGNYRVRYGPFKGVGEAGQSIQNLKKQVKASPIMINLERLVEMEGK